MVSQSASPERVAAGHVLLSTAELSDAGEPADPAGIVIVGAFSQLSLQGEQDLTDERVMPMPRERVVGEQQQAVVGLMVVQSLLVTANEIRDVVGDHHSTLLRRDVEQFTVVGTAEVSKVGILHRDDVVAAVAKLLSHRR